MKSSAAGQSMPEDWPPQPSPREAGGLAATSALKTLVQFGAVGAPHLAAYLAVQREGSRMRTDSRGSEVASWDSRLQISACAGLAELGVAAAEHADALAMMIDDVDEGVSTAAVGALTRMGGRGEQAMRKWEAAK